MHERPDGSQIVVTVPLRTARIDAKAYNMAVCCNERETTSLRSRLTPVFQLHY
jgi:hypothetical protein